MDGALKTNYTCSLLQVILLKRQSNQFALYDWYSKFCGVSGDGRDLLSYASTVSMARRVMLPDLVDEFAPVSICLHSLVVQCLVTSERSCDSMSRVM